jgi:hypothetical protein
MSTHAGDNILFDLEYGANKFGIMLVTPTDMMHACDSGLIKYVNKIFVASMSLSVQVQVELSTVPGFTTGAAIISCMVPIW